MLVWNDGLALII